MLHPPLVLAAFDHQRFEVFLGKHGVLIQDPTNEYEVMRYRWMNNTHIVYRNAKNRLRYTGLSADHYQTMLANKALAVNGKGRVRLKFGRKLEIRERLLERDGDRCWLTDQPMTFSDPKAADFATIEHLWPASQGGPNVITNLVLVGRQANQDIGNMSLVDKIKLRDERRALARRSVLKAVAP